MGDRKTLTIDISTEVHVKLQRLADEQGIEITELFKRAVALHKYVWEHQDELVERFPAWHAFCVPEGIHTKLKEAAREYLAAVNEHRWTQPGKYDREDGSFDLDRFAADALANQGRRDEAESRLRDLIGDPDA